jgi:prepilin-type N-terminal cleavage/methylation domain-containing protein
LACGPRRGFTLVELVTAAALMSIMMLGVVQVFGIITRTAAEAEAISYAQQEMRAFFDRLHDDLRGMTREGYLSVAHYQHTPPNPWPSPTLPPEPLSRDTLAFVTIGPCSTAWSSTVQGGLASEVVYTNNVWTPKAMLRMPQIGNPSVDVAVDPRKGVLARGQWLMTGSGGSASDGADFSKAPYLADLFSARSAAQQSTTNALTEAPESARVIDGGAFRPQVVVWPWRTLTGTSDQPASLRRVIASCVSQFFVDVYNPLGTTDKTEPRIGGGGFNYARMDAITGTYRWGSLFPAKTDDGTAVEGDKLRSWPRAIRVTVAVHDPVDDRPLPPPDPADKGFRGPRGYCFQEAFWISDP